ncbi:MAG: response regulator [Planctomycetaceae bacterium]|nr:response regulator [Planctomycetaceae bacterium]
MDLLKALVVEDNVPMASVLAFNLHKAGFVVVVAHSGTGGLELFATEDFDVVLTDYQMPGCSGEELCRTIRGGSRHADVPLFLITAKTYELDTERLCSELQLSGVLEKPFSPKHVVTAVQAAVMTASASAVEPR